MKSRNLLAKVIITFIFAILNALALKLKIIPIIGTDKFFPAANSLGPSIGAIIGPKFGPLAVIISILLKSGFKVQKGAILVLLRRLGLPMALASLYFGTMHLTLKKRLLTALIPFLMMFAFIIHPIGSQVWYFSLFWLIPIIAILIPKRKIRILLMAWGATLVDHAVGSVLYLYTLNIPVQSWIQAIPHTILERLSFGLGILLSYFILRAMVWKLDKLLGRFNLKIKELFGVIEPVKI